MHRVGFLSPLQAVPEPTTLQAFRQALRELGYVEGKNVLIEARFGGGRQDLYPEMLADLLKLKVEVLLLGSDIVVQEGKKATTTVPIVFAGVGDPVNSGLVASLARPGGNITGVTFGAGGAGIGAKWVELLQQAVPRLSHVAVLFSAVDPTSVTLLREIDSAALALKMKVSRFEVANAGELDRAFRGIGTSGAQGFIVVQSAMFAANRARLIEFGASKRLPGIYFFNLFPRAGGLMSYGGNPEESYRRAASHVAKILKGAKPADLPVEQPTRIEFVINLKAAREIGLAIPQSLLLRADQVIE